MGGIDTAELLMTCVENGASFTCDFGDIEERLFISMESALDELADLLHGDARGLYPLFLGRLASLAQRTTGIGWGFHH